jgi:PAS domain S-box-containing protein
MRGRITAYVWAMAALAAALLIRWLLDPILGDGLPLVTIFGAVAAAVWVGGYRPAVMVAVVGFLACSYLFIEPRGAIGGLDRMGHLVGMVAYLFTCGLIIGIGEGMRVAKQRANQRREALRVTLASIGDAVITTDVKARITYLNNVAESVTGWPQADALGQPLDAVFRVVDADTRRTVENPATRALREGVVVGLANHTVLIRKQGDEIPIDDSAAPIRDEQGLVSGCVLIFRDVSAQRRATEEKARQLMTARLLSSIVETSDDAIVSKSLDGIIQSWNAAAERVFGYTAAEAIGRHITLVIPPERVAEEDHIIATLKAGRRIEHFETERVRKDGQRIHVSLTVSPIKDDAGNIVGASKIARDITDRKRAEADRQMLVTLVESSTDFIGMCDLQGVPFFVNRAGLTMVGLDDLEEARRMPVQSFFFPEDQAKVMQEFFPSVLERGQGEIDVRFRHFKTGEARWMAYKVVTLPDAAGKPVAFATVSRDVTERKQLEDNLRVLAADLSEADRRKNEFLAILAHELRNPLAPISNAVRALRGSHGDAKVVRPMLGMLDRQVAQMSRLVDDLLDLSRVTRGKITLRKQAVELAPVVNQAVEAVRALYGSMNHTIMVTLPSEPVYLTADPARLAQVIGNLLNNACKFTDPGGQVWLAVLREGTDVVIRVRDNGIGIATEQLPHLFQMFTQADRSLERTRDGLGIGLTLVKVLAEMHDGRVDVRSAGLGQGSEFEVRLPALAAAEVPAPAPLAEPTPAVGRRVLIVDDNYDGADSLAMLLEEVGHETHKAHDGIAAIADAERIRPDVVLLDIGLPKLNGYEVCRRLRERPWGKDLCLIALTGWGQEEDRQRSQEAGFDTHLVKPVDHDLLLKLIDSLPARRPVATPDTAPSVGL